MVIMQFCASRVIYKRTLCEKKLLQWISDCAILCCWSYNNRTHCVFILWVRFLIVWQYNYEINLRFWSLGNDERFKQVSIGLMVFLPCWIFFARQSDPKLCEVQQIWQSFCFVLDVVISILLWQKNKIKLITQVAELSDNPTLGSLACKGINKIYT